MARGNQNNPFLSVIALGNTGADSELPALYLPKKSKIESVTLLNGAGVSASDTNYLLLKLLSGTDVIASLDTRSAGQGAVTSLVGKAFSLDSDEALREAGESLKFSYDETDGLQEITNITCAAASGLDAKSFLIYDDAGSVGVWFDGTGTTTIPAGANAAARAIKVTVTGLTTAAQAATALAAALDGDSKFDAVVSSSTHVIVTSSTVGTRTDAANAAGGESAGFTYSITQQGANASSMALTNALLVIEHYPL